MAERNQWEYQLFPLTKENNSSATMFETLDTFGQKGWEVTTIIQLNEGPVLVLKRTRGWG